MGSELATLIDIDFRGFKFSRTQTGLFNELSMAQPQYEALIAFLNQTKPEIERIISLYGEPEDNDMELMGVNREDVGYRSISISITFDETTHLPKDWNYHVAYLTKENGSPRMALGDRHYTRKDLQPKKSK